MTKPEKPEKIFGTTPIGSAKWAHIHKPREPFAGDKDKGRKFEIEVHFDPEDPAWKPWAAAISERIRAMPVKTKEQRNPETGDMETIKIPKQYPIKKAFNKDKTPTGKYCAVFRTGEQYPPKVFDRYNRRISDVPMIGNDSQVRVAYSESAFDAFGGGINLYLDAVQIIELRENEGRSAEQYGFSGEQIPENAPPLPGSSTPPPPPEDDLPF